LDIEKLWIFMGWREREDEMLLEKQMRVKEYKRLDKIVEPEPFLRLRRLSKMHRRGTQESASVKRKEGGTHLKTEEVRTKHQPSHRQSALGCIN
jgi:hypothetical protein